eukprot:CAMPEP_0181185226 /NCGR_PEP_ID=MMETSP1096-20121128/9391_1 /TAXON_ID=156174 ORGANISM="Chrysochromulina ericina, Strain CCMP281" /NCGR_SAMPLE_ID=MMETSP1096 /ASSEMBLY_ACC=CAM_ASM_000453 /LENGTH=129 /DNA_ID=CAMNT_0023274049 /DNA_START=637 /DNA_END=1026 /DNA_ORIENTATION=-
MARSGSEERRSRWVRVESLVASTPDKLRPTRRSPWRQHTSFRRTAEGPSCHIEVECGNRDRMLIAISSRSQWRRHLTCTGIRSLAATLPIGVKVMQNEIEIESPRQWPCRRLDRATCEHAPIEALQRRE